jgi:hypothetical protein
LPAGEEDMKSDEVKQLVRERYGGFAAAVLEEGQTA